MSINLEEIENIDDISHLKDLKIEKNVLFNPLCVRKETNWGKVEKQFIFDALELNFDKEYNLAFDEAALLENIKTSSPKLHELMNNIKKLDEKDMEKHGKLFKHFIFSDLKSSNGVKILASAFIAHGYNLGYTAEWGVNKKKKEKYFGKIELLSDNELSKHRKRNFYLLSSVNVYNQPISVKTKKDILSRFNERPDNVYGDKVRFIIMDSGFKEGIDLFDIKYIHIFEPSLTLGDQKQIIGRGTRFCGQKGLKFHPTKGWGLNVFIYDLKIDEKFNKQLLESSSGIDLYMKAMKLNINMINLASEFERLVIVGAVDYELNKNVHEANLLENASLKGGKGTLMLPDSAEAVAAPKITFQSMREYIRNNFMQYKWDKITMENLCGYAGPQKGGQSTAINFTPTQGFIQQYFTPQNPIKGMLLNHSVGTGKTCTAIATASYAFEQQGYTIVWVTRATLKNDIWKNMFDQVCNEQLRIRMNNAGFEIPKDSKNRMKLLSKSWKIHPISYKQFSNLVSKQNIYYDKLVKINGGVDPLRKTLLIIDEAHKLYGGGDLNNLEKPDMNAFHASLMHSYKVSGNDSVKLLLMTATPIIESPMELVQLLNLCKPREEQIEDNFDIFSEKYLDDDGKFTEEGEQEFLDKIAGHISYLNRGSDARQFAQPKIIHVDAPILSGKTENYARMFDKQIVKDYFSENVNKLKQQLIENESTIKDFKGVSVKKFNDLYDKCTGFQGKKGTKCKKIIRDRIKEFIAKIKDYVKTGKEKIKFLKIDIKDSKALKTAELKKVKNLISENADKYDEYKRTPYSRITSKCKKTITINALNDYIDNLPIVKKYDDENMELDNEIEELTEAKKYMLLEFKQYLKDLQLLLQHDLPEEQRHNIKELYEEGIRKYKISEKETNSALQSEINRIKEQYKHNTKTKKNIINRLRKSLKRKIVKMKKDELAEEKELKKTQRKLNEIIKTQNDFYNENLATYKKSIDDEISKLDELEAAEKREKEAKKQQKAAEKAAAKEHKKTQKAAEREAIKQQKAAEKAAAKEHKKTQKATKK